LTAQRCTDIITAQYSINNDAVANYAREVAWIIVLPVGLCVLCK